MKSIKKRYSIFDDPYYRHLKGKIETALKTTWYYRDLLTKTNNFNKEQLKRITDYYEYYKKQYLNLINEKNIYLLEKQG